ncbi:hypothetical protein A9Q86_15340 [Flavobacteriales bacterium 33_180_T64]|nr:hypothetical protein A9Q86_15340 [Flavobacteriales bacterium 33_180_T64]
MGSCMYGQELPEVIPPSPTVANLMQFEEVPVSHYTGQPNISIPIYSKSINSELGINLALSYNTQGVKINNRSGWVGTGWSLEAGGVISRTVRGIADEKKLGEVFNGPITDIGVFHNNDFWDYETLDDYNKKKFHWRANGGDNKYDYESDLFQFNALGLTGRFVIIKENGVLVPKLLTKNQNIKIAIDYGTASNSFELNSFTLTDTKGNIYIFDKKEILSSEPFIAIQKFNGDQTISGQNSDVTTTNAWYLSKIETSNGNELVRFEYQEIEEDYIVSIDRTYNEITYISTPIINGTIKENEYNASILKPEKVISYYRSVGDTQKLQKIIFRDNITIEFLATSSNPETGGAALSHILIKDSNGNENKRYSFNYDQLIADRLWLTSIDEKVGLLTNPYILEYIDKNELPSFDSISDAWGYNEGMSNVVVNSSCNVGNPFDKDAIQKGLLSKIIYPTGGVKEFEFEHNRITYQSKTGILSAPGNEDPKAVHLSDVYYQENNPDNWVLGSTSSFPTFNNNTSSGPESFTINQATEVIFNVNNFNIDISGCAVGDSEESILFNSKIEIVGTGLSTYHHNIRLDNLTQDQLVLNLAAGTYEVSLLVLNTCPDISFNLCYNERTYTTHVSRFVYGGGVRIKEIRFNDNNTATIPSRKISYDYTDTTDDTMSSGGIDGDLEGLLKEYNVETERYIFNGPRSDGYHPYNMAGRDIHYTVRTEALNVELTQGNYVGYKTVNVSEEDNGFTRYTFTSPQDYASPSDVFVYPFKPAPNIDFKRGLLLKKQIFEHNNQPYPSGSEPPGKLIETENTYTFIEEIITPSYTLFNRENCIWVQFYNSFDSYIAKIVQNEPPCDESGGCITGLDNCYDAITPVESDLNLLFYFEESPVESGWAQLTQTKTTNYFYDDQDNQTSIESRQTFEYNDDNFQISKQHSYVYELGIEQDYLTEYYYPVGTTLSSNTIVIRQALEGLNKINEVLETVSYKNTVKLSQTNTIYNEFATNQVLPQDVQVSKGSAALESRIEFKRYDTYGNPLEVSKVDGIPISYIWGYDNMYPVAKLVGVSFSEIEQLMGNDFNAGIGGLTTGPSGQINILKSNFLNAQISTYEYDTMVGITKMTDARGYFMTYHYDEFNRLKHVKDEDGNILSENEYNYKNQY